MTEPLVIIQARVGSRRLPAKSLVNFRGLPIAILAARRAASRGHNVVLATSTEASDDMLVNAAAAAGLAVVRGPLDDVLARFCKVLGDTGDRTPVLRLTGDNIVPDGGLITEVIEAFETVGADYMTTGTFPSGLPYGVSIEITRAGHLRAAHAEATTAYEREHVTPWIRARFATVVFEHYRAMALDRFRLTIDTMDDLISMDRVFPKGCTPENVPWLDIVKRSHLGQFQPTASSSCGDLILGTAQLGMQYGINNSSAIRPEVGRNMIREAIANGVAWVDTARAYGASEQTIGSVIAAGWDDRVNVITKLSPLAEWKPKDQPKGARAAAEASLWASCQALGKSRLDTVLIHRQSHWDAWDGVISGLLREWVDAGRIRCLGVSVQSPEELDAALHVTDLTHIQMPFNILDHRWDKILPRLEQVRRDRPLTVHIRSVFLQGLLLSDDSKKWFRAGHPNWTATQKWLSATSERLEQSGIDALCINWVRGLSWVDGVVVGMDNPDQLQRNISIFSEPPLPTEALRRLPNNKPFLAPHTLDPAQWKSGL
ncbi:spore coat polysaccharide biosynthesis protein SpsF [Sulfitobacter pontiacus]|uniref:Spore coat polysaccharide biosynthesis protein SpsF n=1 Tax=Sulfitobacter pontiacus TaxID=60137 RepID=A0A1H3DMD2_9RHOB|nr:aldo/keto reductase [Sulfitobacter pontiacus]SDX67673.1 spore coat polysaccharide biosynthesis protein SpsF [Sulfitobacter pontiacus]|tara:strand:+ start:5907 stop:7535 length:1629 start_codon:yes stop_codon:yes gene_type:complete